MALLDFLRTWLDGAKPNPTTGAIAVRPASEGLAISRETVDSIRRTLDSHDAGDFERSAMLASLLRRNADFMGALQQRLLGLASCEHVIEPVTEAPADVAMADTMRAVWPRVVSTAAQNDVVGDAVVLGFGWAQIVPRWDDARGQLVPHLDPWPAGCTNFDPNRRVWQAFTSEGTIDITPGDGTWVLFAPRSERAPHLWGALRATAAWYLRGEQSGGGASRQAEVHGSPIWKAKLPAGARQTTEGKAFAQSLRTMGRNAVIPVPQGSGPESSYDVEIIEAKSDAYKVFEFLMQQGGRAMRLSVLGQDLTSANTGTGTYAQSKVGRDVTGEIILADARAWSECLSDQVLKPWGVYLGSGVARVTVDAEADEDFKMLAETWNLAGDALQKLQGGGVDVDVVAYAKRFGIPLRQTPSEPKRLQVYAYHLQYGLLTVNEARKLALGLGPIEGGDKPPALLGAPSADPPPTDPSTDGTS